jgi:hypothetical protein
MDLSQLATDFTNLRTEWSTTFTHKNASYTGILSDVGLASELQEGGFLQEYDSDLSILVSDFTTLPVVGENVTIASVIYRIGKVSKSPCGKVNVLSLISPEK